MKIFVFLSIYRRVLFLFFVCVLTEEPPNLRIFTDHDDNKYNVDEDVVITAHIENPSSVSCVIWQIETPNGDRALDTDHELSKYKTEQNSLNEATLLIQGCCETDKGPYFLLASCSDDTEVKSNKVFLNIMKGKHL